MNNFSFHAPTEILFGDGQVSRIGSLVKEYGDRCLMVYGGGTIKRIGLYDTVKKSLADARVDSVELGGVEPNPRLSSVRKGIELCRKNNLTFILAVGGGSVIDASKAIAAGVDYNGDVWDFYLRKASVSEVGEVLPLGTILTLSATGSEMNGNSVITNWETNEKLAIGSPRLFPRFSILDPTVTYSLPSNQTAYGAADIMAHVFEQYFHHTAGTTLQDRLCEAVMMTVIEHAPIAIANPEDYNARANLMWGSTLGLNTLIGAGVAQDWASHGIEHEVSAIYDIPHGAGLAVICPNWMRYVMHEGISRFVQYAVRVWGVDRTGLSDEETALEGIKRTRNFFNRLGLPSTLSAWNIGGSRIDEMAEKSVRFGPVGGLKRLSKDDVAAILRASL